MALPSSYIESTLRDYMFAVTGSVASALGWTAVNFTEAVNDVLFAYGVTDIADAADIAKLRALAKVEAWRAVADATVADYQFSADGGSYSRQQMHQQAVAAWQRAEAEAVAHDYVERVAPTIAMGSMKHRDPYLSELDDA